MPSERCPFAIWTPGPAWKVGYAAYGTSGLKRGIVPHSAEGWMQWIFDYMAGRTEALRRASWQFTIDDDGALYQHYEVTAHCWHAGDIGDDGGVRANIDLVGVEHIGRAGTPINDLQIATDVRLYYWLQTEHGFQPYELWRTVYEHGWVSDEPTACPSGRIRHDAIKAKLAELFRPPAAPTPPPPEEDEMKVVMIKKLGDGQVWLTDWIERRKGSASEIPQLQYIGVMGPVTVAANLLDATVPVA